MNTSNLVSVIIPVYNCEEYLDRCVNSVLMQSYDNIEIIIVNDGSTDNSPDICDMYNKLDNIHVIHQKNMGLSIARNNGAIAATGQFIMFIDSDDYIHPQTIEYLCEIQFKTKANVVIGGYHRTDQREYIGFPTYLCLPEYRIITSDEAVKYLFCDIDCIRKYGTAWGKLYKRDHILKFPFPAGKLWEDAFVLYKILAEADTITVCDEPFYCYFINQKGISNQDISFRDLDLLEAESELTEYMRVHKPYYLELAIQKEKNEYKRIYQRALESNSSKLVSVLTQMYSKHFGEQIDLNDIDV